ncbi:MAG: hypothetical protein ACXIUB_01365 [Wenzhouxiangella sp.]
MKQQFRAEHQGIKSFIEKQSGGSPGNIIANAIRKYGHQPFDQRFLVLDTDVAISQQERDTARTHGYHIILWSPVCLEGALLDVLGQAISPDENAASLKGRLHPVLDGQPTDHRAYQNLFPKAILEQANNQSVVAVKQVLLQPVS